MALVVLLASTPGEAETDAAATATRAAEMLLEAAAALAEGRWRPRPGSRRLRKPCAPTRKGFLRCGKACVRPRSGNGRSCWPSRPNATGWRVFLGVLQSIQSAPGPILMLHP